MKPLNEDVLRGTARLMGIEPKLCLNKSNKTPQARKIFCRFAGEFGFPTIDTGNFLDIQQAAVSNAARKGADIVKQCGHYCQRFFYINNNKYIFFLKTFYIITYMKLIRDYIEYRDFLRDFYT
jgi:hypothetical protein